MCLLCIEIQKGNMKANDFAKNFTELANTDPKLAEELVEKYPDKVGGFLFPEEDDFGELDWMPFGFLDDHFDD